MEKHISFHSTNIFFFNMPTFTDMPLNFRLNAFIEMLTPRLAILYILICQKNKKRLI